MRDKLSDIDVLNDTLKAFDKGQYKVNNKTVTTLDKDTLSNIEVYLPVDIDTIVNSVCKINVTSNNCKFDCHNVDTFSMVKILSQKGVHDIIALNLASPVNPGGGVRGGAKAQEEDLCRKSSLLLSLESKKARSYYDFNKKANTFMGTDAMMITPVVQIIRDDIGRFQESVTTSVLTCAAPKLIQGTKINIREYRELVYNRIILMLTVVANKGYKNLILGAWGCGAYGNDAATISNIFRSAILNFKYQGYSYNEIFDSITFAVLDKTSSQYNFKQFKRNFR